MQRIKMLCGNRRWPMRSQQQNGSVISTCLAWIVQKLKRPRTSAVRCARTPSPNHFENDNSCASSSISIEAWQIAVECKHYPHKNLSILIKLERRSNKHTLWQKQDVQTAVQFSVEEDGHWVGYWAANCKAKQTDHANIWTEDCQIKWSRQCKCKIATKVCPLFGSRKSKQMTRTYIARNPDCTASPIGLWHMNLYPQYLNTRFVPPKRAQYQKIKLQVSTD